MPNQFAITHAIRDSKHQIAAIVISDTPTGRKFVGGFGRTFVSTEIEDCTEEDFISRLPHKTAQKVLALPAGAHTFDVKKGEWT